MKICVFGGTFDPPHLGHENIINELLIKFDKVIIVPSKITPGKKKFPLANNLARLKMLSLCSFAKDSNCIISDYEIISNRCPSYTIDTIKHLKNEFKNSNIYMAIGLDQLNNLNDWHDLKTLLTMVKIICFNRGNYLSDKILPIDCEFIANFNYDISSSEIRSFILNNSPNFKDMINKDVLNYIIEEKIYR